MPISALNEDALLPAIIIAAIIGDISLQVSIALILTIRILAPNCFSWIEP